MKPRKLSLKAETTTNKTEKVRQILRVKVQIKRGEKKKQQVCSVVASLKSSEAWLAGLKYSILSQQVFSVPSEQLLALPHHSIIVRASLLENSNGHPQPWS